MAKSKRRRQKKDLIESDQTFGSANSTPFGFLAMLSLGLWTLSFFCAFIYLLGLGNFWSDLGFYTMTGGTICAVLAALPGMLASLSPSEFHVKEFLDRHSIQPWLINSFGTTLWMKTKNLPGTTLPICLSTAGFALLRFSERLSSRKNVKPCDAGDPALFEKNSTCP